MAIAIADMRTLGYLKTTPEVLDLRLLREAMATVYEDLLSKFPTAVSTGKQRLGK